MSIQDNATVLLSHHWILGVVVGPHNIVQPEVVVAAT